MNRQTLFAMAATLCMALQAHWANAQHSDVWVILDGNQVALSPTDLQTTEPVKVDATTGKYLFTSDFGEFFGGPFLTDDPGIQSQAGAFTAGARLNYRAVEPLKFWNGDYWDVSVPDAERVLIEDSDFPQTITAVSTSGVTDAEGFIQEVFTNGSVHKHVDFRIDNSLGTDLPAFGAYMIELELVVVDAVGAVVHTASDPFRIVINFQLSTEEYDEAVAALTAPAVNVPIPGYALILLAVMLLLSRRIAVTVKA